MKLSMFVIFVIIRFDRANISTRAAPAPAVATCTPGEITPTDSRPFDGLRIVCPQNTNLQQGGIPVPGDSGNAEVLAGAGGEAVPLRTLLPWGTYKRTVEGGVNVDTLAVSQLPEKPATLYFECRHGDGLQSCYIQVNVLPAHRLGPNVCAHWGSRLKFSVHAENETVLFNCAAGFRLLPAEAAKVYDGNCQHELHLDDALPGSYIKHADDNHPNMLVVVYLPAPPQSLCYICAPPGNQPTASNNCFVRVSTVAGSGAPPPPKTTASAAVGATARTASVLGLLLVGTGHLNIS